MRRLLNIGKHEPVHLFLLPALFIFHAWVHYIGLLNSNVLLFGFLKVLGAVLIFFLIWWLVWKDKNKAAIFTSVCGIFYLFFGDIKNGLKDLPVLGFFAHYKIFVPLVLLIILVIFLKLRRKQKLTNTTLFLNSLLIIYVIIDAITWINPPGKNIGIAETKLQPVRQLDKTPNIYYILLDCYPSTSYQKEMLDMNGNFYLDSSLKNMGFNCIEDSRSNYSMTAFSMASNLGLNYLTNIDTLETVGAPVYNRSMAIVRNSPFIDLVSNKGYQIYNYSIFDIKDKPALRKDDFLSASSSTILFYNTAWNTLRRELWWKFVNSNKKAPIHELVNARKKFFEPQKEYNLKLLDSLTIFQGRSPFFLYAHLKMPHFPYFFDSAGHPNPDESVYDESMITNKRRFAGYIRYTDQKVVPLIEHFIQISQGKDIIIIQSDHAIADLDWTRKQDAFRNYSAFYFPDKDYSMLYKGMSNINTFRVILNKYFGQQLSLLPDKSYYIR